MTLNNNILHVLKGDTCYIKNSKVWTHEFLEEEELNFEDFLNDLISGGFYNFELYTTLTNAGLSGLLVRVNEKEIIYEK